MVIELLTYRNKISILPFEDRLSIFTSRIIQKRKKKRTRYIKKFIYSKSHERFTKLFVNRSVARVRTNRIKYSEDPLFSVARLANQLAIERPIERRQFEKTRKDTKTNETRIDKFSRCSHWPFAIQPRIVHVYRGTVERKVHLFRLIHELTSGKSGGLLLFSSITRTVRSVDEVEQGREEDGGTVDVKSAGKRENKRDEKAWGNCVETDTRPLPSAFPRFPRPFPRAVNHASNFAGLLHPAE